MASAPYQRDIAAVFSEKAYNLMLAADLTPYMMSADPRELYDVLLFVETTTAPGRLGAKAVSSAEG